MEAIKEETEKATFAGGCFWGVEDSFRKLTGVISTRVGYIGGFVDNPTYEMVCSHTTHHAEGVEVTYNPEIISYQELLKAFWQAHNPTTKNRQGWDIGDQYRSAIFYHDDEQKKIATQSKEDEQNSGKYRQNGLFKQTIVTEIVPATTFWQAENYHQQYFEKTGQVSCRIPN